MALIKCPECGNLISDKALKCPKCGCPVGRGKIFPLNDNHKYGDVNGYSEQPDSRKWLYAVIGGLATALVAVVLVLLLRKGDTDETVLVAELPVHEVPLSESPSQEITPKVSTTNVNAVVQGIIASMVEVIGSSFLMGATSEQMDGANDDELPTHYVNLPSFYMGSHEVTQEEWKTVMGKNPSRFKGAKRPVDNVSWHDCQAFISKLNSLSRKRFRLPTEAEWEFAARGGDRSRGYIYSGSNNVSRVAWCAATSGSRTHDVEAKSPNELGIYDMTGNLWEWCADWYGYYDSEMQNNPAGPNSGSTKAIRGGGWNGGPENCRVSNRDARSPNYRSDRLGLRLAMDV